MMPDSDVDRVARTSCHAADRVFLDCLLRWRPRPSCLPHGTVLAVKLIEGHGAGGEREPAGRPDAAGL